MRLTKLRVSLERRGEAKPFRGSLVYPVKLQNYARLRNSQGQFTDVIDKFTKATQLGSR